MPVSRSLLALGAGAGTFPSLSIHDLPTTCSSQKLSWGPKPDNQSQACGSSSELAKLACGVLANGPEIEGPQKTELVGFAFGCLAQRFEGQVKDCSSAGPFPRALGPQRHVTARDDTQRHATACVSMVAEGKPV